MNTIVNSSRPHRSSYKKSELKDMTTFRLREICIREKLIKGIANPLNRQELINTIVRFRGEEETLLIKKRAEGGFFRIEEALKRKLGTRLDDAAAIQNPARMILYRDIALTQFDEYKIRFGNQAGYVAGQNAYQAGQRVENRYCGSKSQQFKDLMNTNVLLVGENNELCCILNITSDGREPESFYLTKDKEQEIEHEHIKFYYLLFFLKEESDYLYQTYYHEADEPVILDYYKIPLADLEIKELEETQAVLSIDFGTSNTTAAVYLNHGYIKNPDRNDLLNEKIKLDEINIVQFLDETKETSVWKPMLPTLSSVSDCINSEDIVYHFGYEARKDTKVKYYDESFSVFYEMKRWVETYQQEQELIDKKGNTATVKRQEIIRRYLLYVIANAEQRFKCRFKKLHLTSPVKLKEQFIGMFTTILPEYEIEGNRMLDEGTAVLYNTITSLIEKKNYYEGERMAALIMDCGGGTTDLSSCEFTIRNEKASYLIDIETTYENGDTNFGGDNITYRIMQYLKIVFADYYEGKKGARIEDFLAQAEMDIYRMVDTCGREKVYEQLTEAYDIAEEKIPTRFRYYENRSREEYYMVKNNFYFLFQVAERLKKKFYQGRGILRNRFEANSEQESDDLMITRIDYWTLSVREGQNLKVRHDFPDIVFNIKEIELLLRADIYWIVDRFLNEFYRTGRLSDFSIIKLTGQSCRIDLFREAIKEFIPGKSIEFKPFGKDESSIRDLKLACVRGAAKYITDTTSGLSEVRLLNKSPRIPYSISGITHEQEEKKLIYNLAREQTHGTLSRNKGITRLELNLRDGDGKLKYHYLYQNDQSTYETKTYEEIQEKYKEYKQYIIQDETDNISNTEVKFFIFAAKEQWGFYLVPIAREGTQLYLGVDAFYPFENNLWDVNFFDGTK